MEISISLLIVHSNEQNRDFNLCYLEYLVEPKNIAYWENMLPQRMFINSILI